MKSATPEDRVSRLVEESGEDVVRFLARRLRNQADAEDLSQEVYLRLMRLPDAGGIRNLRAYALRVAANAAHEWRMLARNRLPHSSEGLEKEVSQAQGPAETALHEEQMRRLSAALSTLSPVCRTAVLLHKRDGLTLDEIACRVGYSVPMVRRYLALGLLTCQEALTRFDGEHA